MMVAIELPDNQRTRIKQQFSAACHSYDKASRLQRITGTKLIDKHLDLLRGQVLDLGCGTGVNTKTIHATANHVVGCDLAFDMTKKTRLATQQQVVCIQGDAAHLPFQKHSFSSVYSNLMLQWFDDLSIALNEIKRVLKPQGHLIFTTLLDGTLNELKSAWAAIDNDNHVNQFSQIADVTSALTASGFEFTIELETVELNYQDVTQLARELKHLGANYVKNRSNKGLMGRQKWHQLGENYQQFRRENGFLPASYQVAYVRAWLAQ